MQCSRCHKESLEYRHTQPFCGPLSGTTHVGWYQKKYLPTYTRPNRQTSFINVLHPPCSIYMHDSPFPQYLSPGPLCLALALTEPSTVCCIHNALLIVCVSLCVSQVTEHPAGCTGADHKNARSHFVCRAFNGHNFFPLVEDSVAQSGIVLASRSGRKIQLSRAARAILRSKGTDSDSATSSPVIARSDKRDKARGIAGCLLLLELL